MLKSNQCSSGVRRRSVFTFKMWTRLGVILLLVYHTSADLTKPDDETWNWVQEIVKNTTTTTTTEASTDEEDIDLTPTDVEKSESCPLPDGGVGICVPYYQCDSDTGKIIEDGTTLLDLRAGKCYSYFDICCKLESTITSPSGGTLAPDTLETTQEDKMLQNPNIIQGCGWENSNLFLLTKKDKEVNADYGQFRWMVAVIKKGKNEAWNQDDYIGGGSIIHPSVVLTTAHKLHKMQPQELKCRAGEWDTQTTKEIYPHQERDVRNMTVHPDFFLTSLYYDVALLFLKTPFDMNVPHIGTACLNKELPPPRTECYSMGWGNLFGKPKEYAVRLKKVKLPLVSAEDCQSALQKSRLGPFFRLHKSLTCAGGVKGIDTCTKDGGSSLVCPIGNDGKNVKYSVVGMVAYAIGKCGRENRPAVYVNVPNIYSWIDEVMALENYGNDSYTV